MKFKYKVIDEQMRLVEGVLEAYDLETARSMILNNNWQIVRLNAIQGLDAILSKTFKSKIKYEVISAFCIQLAMMIRTGVNLVRGLEILQSQMEDKRMKAVIDTIYQGVSRGNSLSYAMKSTKGALPELLVNLVVVGEESGSLDSVLTSMSEYYERESFIRKKITSAAVYPVILTLVLIGLLIFFMSFILPEITGLMTLNNQSLPAITQIVVDVSNFLRVKGWLLALCIGGIGLGLNRLFKIPEYRYYWHTFLLNIPLLGKNMRDIIISRFSRTLALFLHSAIPIIQILDSLDNIVGNEVAHRAVAGAKKRVIQGEPLAQAFGQESFFDPLVIQMMSIGEETGRLEELMSEVANNYDKKVEIGIARLVALVEPAFTVIIGIFAGGLIISIALPIFNMSNVVK